LVDQVTSRWRSATQSWKQIITNEYLLVAGLTVLAAILRLYRIDACALWGDEYNSIRQARDIGISFNSLPYFLFLRMWMNFGSSEFWLRLPAAIFGTLVVPVTYFLGKELFGTRKHGGLAGLLIAISAFTVEYSQQVRFYSLFLFSSSLAFLVFVYYIRHEHTRRRLGILIMANLFCVVTHALGFLVTTVQAVAYWLMRKRNYRMRFVILSVGIILILALPHLMPSALLEYPFMVLYRYQGDTPSVYKGPRGIHPTIAVKIPLAFFFYTFGNSVHPLTLRLVIPGILLLGYLFVRGLWRLRHDQVTLILLLVWLGLSPLLLFLGFDTWAPASFITAHPNYTIYVILAFYLVVVHGILSHRRARFVPSALAVGISIISLGSYYYPSWSDTSRLTDWRHAAQFVQQHADDRTVVLYDGRSADPVEYYFPSSIPSRSLWDYRGKDSLEELDSFDRLVFVSYDSKGGNRAVFTRILQKIEAEFAYRDGFVHYPLFAYVYQRTGSTGYPVDAATGIVSLPKEVYGLPFADLRLPQRAEYAGRTVLLTGSFALPSLDGARERTITLSRFSTLGRIQLLRRLDRSGLRSEWPTRNHWTMQFCWFITAGSCISEPFRLSERPQCALRELKLPKCRK
jgi:hypothetical protein